MKRTLYFLKDSVTGKFYDGQTADISDFVEFDKAVVYFQRENAEKKIKTLMNHSYSGSWPWYENWIKDPTYLKYIEVNERDQHINKWNKLIDERKDLPNWGIEIVAVEIKQA